MKILKGERKLVASREKSPGVTLYNFALDSSTGKDILIHKLEVENIGLSSSSLNVKVG